MERLSKKEAAAEFNRSFKVLRDEMKNITTIFIRNKYELCDPSDISDRCVYEDGKLKFSKTNKDIYRNLILSILDEGGIMKCKESDLMTYEDINRYVKDVVSKEDPIFM